LPGIRELDSATFSALELAETLRHQWVRQTGWDLTPGDWTASGRQRLKELVQGKYTQPVWNEKR
jgi:hypothetical protein